jgi:transposase
LPEHARLQVDSLLAVMAALEAQVATVDSELRRFARNDQRCSCRALQQIYGVGLILAACLRRSFCSLANRHGVDPVEPAQITA